MISTIMQKVRKTAGINRLFRGISPDDLALKVERLDQAYALRKLIRSSEWLGADKILDQLREKYEKIYFGDGTDKELRERAIAKAAALNEFTVEIERCIAEIPGLALEIKKYEESNVGRNKDG